MQQHPNRLWITVLVLGWTFDFLFWKHPAGVQFAVLAGLTIAAAFVLLLRDGLRPAQTSLMLLPVIAFFAVMTFVRAEPMTIFLAYVLALSLMAVLAVTYAGGRWIQYSVADYVARAMSLVGSCIAFPIQFAAETRPVPSAVPGGTRSQLWPVVRGLLLAVPVVVLFAALLSSADLVFAQRLDNVVKLFKLENLPEYLFRAIYILMIAYALAGAYLHAARRSADEKLLGLDRPLIAPFFGFTEAAVVLGSVVLLFAFFGIIQFQYFFGGRSNIVIDGFTYAEYARRGFGELVTVAFFSLLLFLGLSAVIKRGTSAQHNIFAGLGLALLALVAVLLASAFQRLTLYEAAYGFTRLRTYSHVFMIWLGLLLGAVVVLDLIKRPRIFALAAVVAACGFAASLALLDVDAFIVRQNAQLTAQGRDLDVGYLASLSADAVPALVDEYRSPRLTQTAREAAGASLACIVAADKASGTLPRTDDWRSFTLSGWQATAALQSVANELQTYTIHTVDWQRKVTTPAGREYDCWSYASD